MRNELLGSQQAKPRIPISTAENALNPLAYSFRPPVDFEEILVNRFKRDCELMRSRDRLDRREDPVRLAALRAWRLYRPGRARGLIQCLMKTTNLPIADVRRALIHAMDDRANDRGRMDARDQKFFSEILAIDPV